MLTAPGTVLGHGSAAACFGFHRFEAGYETVVRLGCWGRRRHPGLLVFHARTLAGNTTRHAGIPITTAERVLIDIAPGLGDERLGRAFRESIRLGTTTMRKIVTAVHRHRGRPGTPRLLELATRYSGLPYDRTRSNAEARALEVLHDAGAPPPLVNVRVAGVEADLVSHVPKLIIEIDGPQFHLFAEEDARKQAIWEAVGYTVRRIPSGRVYSDPAHLIALYRAKAAGEASMGAKVGRDEAKANSERHGRAHAVSLASTAVPEATATRVELRDGSTMTLRPIEPDDKPLLLDEFARLSPESRRRRYLTPATDLTAEDLVYLTEVDHRRHEAVIALGEDGRCIGVARYVQVPGNRQTAEVAAEVVDDWQRRGVASALLGDLSRRALENGVERFCAYVSSDNEVVLDALGRAGAERTSTAQDGEIEFVVEVPREGLGERLRSALRAAGAGQLRLAARMAQRLGLGGLVRRD